MNAVDRLNTNVSLNQHMDENKYKDKAVSWPCYEYDGVLCFKTVFIITRVSEVIMLLRWEPVVWAMQETGTFAAMRFQHPNH